MLFQMPVTFDDVALYLSREEWGRLDHTQQSYREVLKKRSGLSLGKGWGIRAGPIYHHLLPLFQGLNPLLQFIRTLLSYRTFLVVDVFFLCRCGSHKPDVASESLKCSWSH